MSTIPRLLVAGLCAILTSGCVVGQSLQPAFEPPAAHSTAGDSTAHAARSISIKVTDDRPFVKNGDKPPYYLGKYRSGFGIPWDVETENDEPLAGIVARDLAKDLTALGHAIRDLETAERRLAVSIRDWNFDGYQNGRLWYDLEITVRDAAGATLATSVVKEASHIKGTFWLGARGGAERELPKLYPQIIGKIVRENEAISAAL